ncbi:MAG: proliferating cell nuclear antigen (pcna) [Methanobacteriota archaeon]
MLQAKCKAPVFRDLIEAVSILVDEAKFRVTADGLSIRAVDPAHVAMVDLTLSRGAFEAFKGEPSDLGIDIEKFKEILKLAASEDEVELEHDDEANRLVVRIGKLVRRMSLVDASALEDPKVPNLDLPCEVVLPAAELERGIRASEAVSDHVALIANAQGFEVLAEGDTDTSSLKLAKSELTSLKCKGEVKSLFSLDYFSNMMKAAKNANGIVLSLGSDYPVRMQFDIAEGNGHVTYLLAPRIESE